ncbi:hypothetical protein [Paracoccus sp. S3-43]|uniref:hypothetical protein n=1 Tax=Paracoccus sp. S3-43 TaxID=3030011 RepID=UPI0023AF4E71|nr:hypothetical protein [Paracoccus sp. S3-43]WEF25601.1 hypothetical protein PXD02_06705 [Paracoccus sp. S3-43]
MQILPDHTAAASAAGSRLVRLLGPRRGILRRRRGLDEGERALVAMVAAREAHHHAIAQAYARRAMAVLGDDFAVALVLEEGLAAPLTGRIGALADAAGALAQNPPRLGPAQTRRLKAQRLDADELADLFVTVALVQANLHRAAAVPDA